MRSVAGAVDNSPYQNKLNFRMNIRRKKTTEKQIFNWNSPHKYIFVAMVISFPDETMEISFAIQLTSWKSKVLNPSKNLLYCYR